MEQTVNQSRHVANAIGPRMVGGRYFGGYWRKEYTVDHIETDPANLPTWQPWSITVTDADGTRAHSTAWDFKRDRVISQSYEFRQADTGEWVNVLDVDLPGDVTATQYAEGSNLALDAVRLGDRIVWERS